jgi:hypothetical protein
VRVNREVILCFMPKFLVEASYTAEGLQGLIKDKAWRTCSTMRSPSMSLTFRCRSSFARRAVA